MASSGLVRLSINRTYSYINNMQTKIKSCILHNVHVSIFFSIKETVLISLFLLFAVPSYGQLKPNSRYQAYIDKYSSLAIKEMLKYNIPASITLAQGLLESGAGQSELARKGNNHFGIKCHGWTGKKTYFDDDESNECFRAYNSVLDSYEDHSRFLSTGKRYASLFKLRITDYKGWAHGLKAAGYATNPRYAQSLIDIIETYGLSRFDKAKGYDRFIEKHEAERTNVISHEIRKCNKNYYVIARNGDTFKSLSKEFGISSRKLARYNERNTKEILKGGDVVYLKKKRSKADKVYKGKPHVVKAGESMYSIAQKYGIRLKSLYEKNELTGDYQIRVGDRLKIY